MDHRRLRLVEYIARLRDGANEGCEACAALVRELVLDCYGLRVVEIGIVELSHPDEAVVALFAHREVGDVVEREDPVAPPVGEDLEARAVRGERIRTD